MPVMYISLGKKSAVMSEGRKVEGSFTLLMWWLWWRWWWGPS